MLYINSLIISSVCEKAKTVILSNICVYTTMENKVKANQI